MNAPSKPPAISEVIRTLNLADDKDRNFIIAACFNLYLESIKRIHGRVLLGAADIEAMFAMVDTLMTEREHRAIPEAKRGPELNEQEENRLLNAVEAQLTRRT